MTKSSPAHAEQNERAAKLRYLIRHARASGLIELIPTYEKHLKQLGAES